MISQVSDILFSHISIRQQYSDLGNCYIIHHTPNYCIWLRTYCTSLIWHMVKGFFVSHTITDSVWETGWILEEISDKHHPLYSHNVTSAPYECTVCYVHNLGKQTPSASWTTVLFKSLICFITSLWHLTLLSSVITCVCVNVCVCLIVNAVSRQDSLLHSWRRTCQTDTVFYP